MRALNIMFIPLNVANIVIGLLSDNYLLIAVASIALGFCLVSVFGDPQ